MFSMHLMKPICTAIISNHFDDNVTTKSCLILKKDTLLYVHILITLHWCLVSQWSISICLIFCMFVQPVYTVYPKKYAHGFCFAVFVVVIHWLIFPCPSDLLHWHCGNLTIAPVPAKQPLWIWINNSCEFIMNDCITTTKQSTTKPCVYFLWYTVDGYSPFNSMCVFISL